MSQSQVSAPLTKEQAYTLVDAVMERDDLALTASAHEAENGEWVFEATCSAEPDIEAFNALVHEALGGKVTFSTEKLDPETDWVSQSLEGLKPVTAGGFYVYGSHDADNIPVGLTPLHIDAAQAFGTGHHETTTGCLEAIDTILKAKKPRFMLDVGTGTGVLAIALAKRTRLPVVATDIDPIAVSVTKDNAELNEVGKNILTIEATGLDSKKIRECGPYDMIVANILAGPLVGLAPDIGKAAMPGASVVLSGILVEQAARIVAAYRQQNIVLKQRITRKEWVTLVLEKPSVYGQADAEQQ